jgi:hypothetical protein
MPPKGVIYIGAHFGEGYKEWVEQGVINFMFFEPVKENFAELEARIPETNNVKLFNMALDDDT